MTITECNFSIEHWQETLQKARNMGYQILSFIDWINHTDNKERSIILRHDVDVSLQFALKIARIESDCGITATYFVRPFSKFYDLQNADSRKALHDLTKLNVEVGLHYDRQHYEKSRGSTGEQMLADIRLISNMISKPVQGCAGHRNGEKGPFNQMEIKQAGLLYEAYEAKFIKERKYISDSAHTWREGCLCKWLGKVDHLTVLMHPVWWCEPQKEWEHTLEQIRRGY